MLGLCYVVLSALIVVNGFALPFEGLYKLDIIHYNDFHARFEETSVQSPTCRFNNNSCLGGFPRLYHKIQQLREEKPDSLLLNAGDSFQGTYWYSLLKWNVTQQFMNLLPHDAHALGNHEFDDGPEGLAPYISALKAPVVAANMDSCKEPLLQGLYKPHVIVTRQGRKIGIIGLITPDTAKLSSSGNVTFTDPGKATLAEAQALTAQGVDIIILLSHCGLDVDKKLARDYGQYIDIIVGGHTHSLLWNGPAPSGEAVAGPYPVFVQSTQDKKHKVWGSQFCRAVRHYSGRPNSLAAVESGEPPRDHTPCLSSLPKIRSIRCVVYVSQLIKLDIYMLSRVSLFPHSIHKITDKRDLTQLSKYILGGHA